jgi:hypothetical protein
MIRDRTQRKLGISGVDDPDRHTVHVRAELGRRIGRVGGGT